MGRKVLLASKKTRLAKTTRQGERERERKHSDMLHKDAGRKKSENFHTTIIKKGLAAT